MRYSPEALTAFVEAVDSGSFSAAARRLLDRTAGAMMAGAAVAVEDPCYPGARMAFASCHLKVGERKILRASGVFASAKMRSVVCRDCGLVRFYAGNEALARITPENGWRKTR